MPPKRATQLWCLPRVAHAAAFLSPPRSFICLPLTTTLTLPLASCHHRQAGAAPAPLAAAALRGRRRPHGAAAHGPVLQVRHLVITPHSPGCSAPASPPGALPSYHPSLTGLQRTGQSSRHDTLVVRVLARGMVCIAGHGCSPGRVRLQPAYVYGCSLAPYGCSLSTYGCSLAPLRLQARQALHARDVARRAVGNPNPYPNPNPSPNPSPNPNPTPTPSP